MHKNIFMYYIKCYVIKLIFLNFQVTKISYNMKVVIWFEGNNPKFSLVYYRNSVIYCHSNFYHHVPFYYIKVQPCYADPDYKKMLK